MPHDRGRTKVVCFSMILEMNVKNWNHLPGGDYGAEVYFTAAGLKIT